MNFKVFARHPDNDIDEWASIEVPLQQGIHKVNPDRDDIFESPQWVVVTERHGEWSAALADSEGQAFDILTNREGWGEELTPLVSSSDGWILDKF